MISTSRWYATAPIPASDQPDYINGVVKLTGGITPETLLLQLQAIEAGSGRRRGERNAARTLDLDIVAMGDLVCARPDIVLPHPRAHERAFVLEPLRDVAPGWVHPRLHQTVEALIAALPLQSIRRL